MSGWPAPRPRLSSEAAVKRVAAGGASPLLRPLSLSKRPSTRLAYLSAAGFRLGLAPARSGVQVKVPHFDA